ncbi:MAG TPA: DMT family transporter [Phycisphaerae bacterium]|nr:DMT family transporter [Phycisphaerae bacterium]HOI56472.1 DMT family transporter [Phycisphaerae bacterium]
MKPRTVNLIQLNVAVLLWGGTAVFAKLIPLPASHITCLRSVVAAVALLAFMAATRTRFLPAQGRHYGMLLLLGLLMCLHWVTYFQALKVSTAAVAILSMQTYPVLTALVEPPVFGERIRKLDVAVAGMVFVGVAVMVPQISLSHATTQGILLGIVSGTFFMCRNLITRKYVREYSSSALMFWQVMVTAVLLAPLVIMKPEGLSAPRTLGLVALLGVAFTALPHTLHSASFRHLSGKTIGILGALLPLYGAITGYLVHGETVEPRTALGGAIILACVLFETVRSVRTR